MTLSTDTLIDKISAVIEPAGLVFHDGLSDFSGNATWTRWNDAAKVETIVSLSADANPAVVVGFYDEDSNRVSSSSFSVGQEAAWPFFENTLKQAVS